MDDNVTLYSGRAVTEDIEYVQTKLKAKAPQTSKYGFVVHLPIRRSQLIAILDVTQSLATHTDKYQEPTTRSRALLLLIKQYNLSTWDQNKGTIVELQPEQLIKSLKNCFYERSRHITITEFWRFGNQLAEKFLSESAAEIRQYETSKNLPAYGAFPFVDSSEEVECELLKLSHGVIDEEASVETPKSPPIKNKPEMSTLSLFEQGSRHNMYSQLVAIADIDDSKTACEHGDYKYKSSDSQLRALGLLIRRFSLRRWCRGRQAIIPMSGDRLQKMVTNLSYRRGKRDEYTTIDIWHAGSDALGADTMKWLHDSAAPLKKAQDLTQMRVSGGVVLNNEVEAALSGLNAKQSDVISSVEYDASEDDSPPSRSSRKRKAADASLSARSSSPASRHELDVDFVPPRTPSSFQDTQVATPPRLLGLDFTASISKHLRPSPALPEQSAAVSLDHGRGRLDYFDVVIAENPATIPHPRYQRTSEDIDLRFLSSKIASISSRVQHAVSSLFNNLHLDVALPSPMFQGFGNQLMVLLTRCWGDDWESACQTMTNSRMLSAFNVLKALIAAFLFENIVKDDALREIDIFKSLELSLPSQKGEFVLQMNSSS